MNTKELERYWSQRYTDNRTGWDIGHPSRPLKEYIDQLAHMDLNILIPGAGNAYEAEYLWKSGFKNISVLDISATPLESLKDRIPDFPERQLINENFFAHKGTYDLILEQTFFCSFEPTTKNRLNYVRQMSKLLTPRGKLVGLWFNHPLDLEGNRPYGGSRAEYLSYLSSHFITKTFAPCHNSVEGRKGKELFGIFLSKG